MAIEGFQFIHESTYGRKGKKAMTTKTGLRRKAKWSGREIVAEALRELGNCDHVDLPVPPRYVFGSDLLTFWQNIEQLANDAKDTAGRKLRTDKQLLTAGVCSAPILTADFDANDPFYQDWLRLNLDFLINKYDAALGPVILHTDEKYIHLHYYVAPEVQETKFGFTLEARHDGLRAKNASMKEGDAKTANIAYKQAMKAFQDSYYEQVAKPCGLARSGPKRRRLSRDEWKEEKRLAAHLPQLQLEMQEAERTAELALIELDKAQSLVQQARYQKQWDEQLSEFSKEELTEYERIQHDKITQLKAEQKSLASEFIKRYERNQNMDEDYVVMGMELQAMAFELTQRENKASLLQQSQQIVEKKLRQNQESFTKAEAKLEDAKAVIARAKNWQERGVVWGAFFSRFNGTNRAYEKQIAELKQQLSDQAKKHKSTLSITVKKYVDKAKTESKGLLDLAYRKITRLETRLKHAATDFDKQESENQQMKERNKLLSDQNKALELRLINKKPSNTSEIK